MRQLATAGELSPAAVSMIERGQRVASPREAEALAEALGLPAGSLVARTMLVHEEER